ncbi:TraB/GumN family protein [Pseudoduganella aquatica]|uniref:TraB/GumN family protein n=1 Tax=Pseudoduganella aquatica TaxID=2660641 RepID=A0A7X4H8U1_9BURK|nr:TraB/GumN family protein [Pseudoduganella aquatica]MYN05807.1 TraB/GumN family protein [Pseudoduganella aquatica]
MRRQIIVMFCSLFLLLPGAAQAGTAVDRGALFKLEQGGHTAYLFGTIHVGAADFYPLEPRVMQALQRATVLALEVDPLGDPAKIVQAVREHGMYARGGGPASAELPVEYRQRLARLLRRYAIDDGAVAAMKPWMLASLLTVSEFAAQGYQASLAVDSWLSQQARERKLPVLELESVGGQMALFSGMSAAEQALFLQEGIAAIEDQEQAAQAREITDAWRKADAAALEALARKAADDGTFSGRFVQQVLLDGRNPALADNIVKLLAREKNSLVAIGVLHLVGTNSVPELLKQRGVAVERIY